MTERQRPMDSIDLERELSELAHYLDLPPTPDLAGSVRRAVAERPATNRHAAARPIGRILLAAAVVVLALVGGLIVSSGFRTTLADLLGVRGIQITFERGHATATAIATTPPSVDASPIGSNLLLGQRMTLTEARRHVTFSIGVPSALGQPDEVYLRRLPDGNTMVSLLYTPRPDLPETAATGAGALIMQFASDQPLMYLGKQLSEGNRVRDARVNGIEAMWVEGVHTLTLLTDPSRGCCDDSGRVAGNVLLWEAGDVTFRFESSLSQDDAVAIAASIPLDTLVTPSPSGN